MVAKRIELTDDELEKVIGGVSTKNEDYTRKHEIELGDFVPDAYKRTQNNKDPNEVNILGNNNPNVNPNIDNDYVPFEYEGKVIK